ncbi:MAG TPA: hemolysin family protein [Mycobacteriales bacterium]
MLLDILIVLLFILVGGLFAAAEIALVSLREGQVKALAERGKRGRRVARLVSDPNRFLAAVQIGVTLAGFLSAAFGAATLSSHAARGLERLGLDERFADPVAFVGVTALISYVSLVLGELVPKRLALQRSEGIALAVASPLDRLATLFRPVIWLLSVTGDALVRLFGGDPEANRETISGEELRDLVAAHESLGRDERALIDDVFSAGDRQVREVMLPRTEVEFLDGAMTVGRAARIAGASPHSRYPVVGESSDDVVGFVHLRDLLVRPDGDRSTTVAAVAREVKRLPGTKRVLAALSEMRREGHHLAIVVDEYGGTDGIVTLEDLIEEVIGEIRDEYDTPPTPGEVRPNELDGLCNLDEVRESTGLELPDGPYETLAGFVMAGLGTLPTLGAEVEVEGWRLTVVALDGRRASCVRVNPPTPAVTGAPAPVEP